MKNKGLEYNKWIFQELEKLIQVKMWKKKRFSREKDFLLTNLVAST